MKIGFKKRGDVLLANFSGELDHHTAGGTRRTLEKHLSDNTLKYLIVDLENLKFMDSSGVGVLIGRYKTLRDRRGKMVIVNANPRIEKLARVAGLDKIIGICPDMNSALKYLRR